MFSLLTTTVLFFLSLLLGVARAGKVARRTMVRSLIEKLVFEVF